MYQTLGICKPIDRADSPMNKLFAHGKKTKDKGTRRLAIRRQAMVRHVRGNSRTGIWQLVGSGSCSIHRRTSRTEQKRNEAIGTFHSARCIVHVGNALTDRCLGRRMSGSTQAVPARLSGPIRLRPPRGVWDACWTVTDVITHSHLGKRAPQGCPNTGAAGGVGVRSVPGQAFSRTAAPRSTKRAKPLIQGIPIWLGSGEQES
jgi:hypothetical protein